MNHLFVGMWLFLLFCECVPGQEAELDAWLESLDRGPSVGPPEALRPGIISARSLAHKPLPKARQEFNRGMQARRKGHAADATEHFAAAARLDPNFVDANAYAALVHAEAHQPSRALPYYQQAVRLEPANAALLANLASVLIALSRPADAEGVARRAVRLAPGSVEAHYMLGFALFGQGEATEETAAHLTIAAEKYAPARQMLATVRRNSLSAANERK